ncbi:UDP-glycosyltransferase 85C1-like [Rutidosis leptorrhynchoides]|uniref:UDP-glycosyltransferase 85C1-like n=1 Tax=Rutidosis leptorrhynchoides TaxID=125765 RepID=UPI003A98FEBD
MDVVTRNTVNNPHVIFVPFPAQSHIKCMLKLAKLLHHKGFHITFVNTQSNHNRLVKSGATRWLNDTPGFEFKTVSDGVPDDSGEHTSNILEIWLYLEQNFLNSFLDLVSGLETRVTCIICDAYMTYTNTVYAAEKLKVPIILFWTTAACGFMGVYQTKVLKDKGILPLKDESYVTNGFLDMKIDWIPGMEHTRLKDLPDVIFTADPNCISLKYYLKMAQEVDKVSHMIINTFQELEASLVKEIRSIVPNIYTVGPLQLLLNKVTEKETYFSSYSLWNEEPECVKWLQSKEPNSVLYVNFGSLVVMSPEDLVELGWGLVNSNHEFLWIIRNDSVNGKPAVFSQELEKAINKKGFIASWCSQEEVLNHPSVGGFLTHGGWGSTIESLSAGVPMICCPFTVDQLTNCRQMCKEWEVGMEIERNIKRDEVEKLVRILMDEEEGVRMRKKALEWKKKAEIATDFNGSSSLNTEKLVNEIIKLSRK